MRTFFLITALLILTGCEMPDGEAPQIEEVIFQGFNGWSPANVPPTDLYPRLLKEGELIDARGVVVDPDGVIRWRRDQYTVPAVGKTLLDVWEYKASPSGVDKNQMLAFCTDGHLYKLETDWPSASATQFAYGYELFNGTSWSDITSGLATSGRRGFCAARDVVLVGHRSEATKRWNGTALTDAGILPPSSAPYLNEVDIDFTNPAWTESDGDGVLTVAAAKVTATNINPASDSYVQYDYTADHFGDFVHTFTFYFDNATNDGGEFYVWALAEESGSASNWSTYLALKAARSGSTYTLTLEGTGVSSDDLDIEIETNTPYYMTISRYGNAITVSPYQVYIGTPPDSIEAACTAEALRYMYVMSGSDDAGAVTACGYVEDLNLGEYTAPTGSLPAGTYSYCYTYGNSEWESMPSPILDVTISADDKKILLKRIAVGPTGTTWRRIYRAYTSDITDGARGSVFGLLEEITDNTTTTYSDNTQQAYVGLPMAYDHAIPPRGDLLVYHNNRVFMANCSCTSRSYDDYETTGLDNVLFWSELDEPYYWPSVNYLRVGDNTPIKALVSWRDWLFIFKESSVWVLRGYDAADFQLAQLTNEYGCVHQNAAASGPPGVLWRDKGGLCFFNGVGIQVILDYAISSTFGPPATTITQPTIAYHRSKFYILEGNYLLTYDPEPQRWGYRDFDETTVGIRAFNFGRYQSHLLSYWVWKTGSSYLGVLDTGKEFGHYADQGTTTSVNEFAPVQITLPPLLARPGEEIVPVEVWIDGTWTAHATTTRRPYIYLNDDADYSATAGQNAWAAATFAPKDGNVIGVPQGYTYDSTGKTNAFKTLYIQIKATEAEDFVLTAVGLRFKRRSARG